jgi:hypothetical protein
MLSITGSLEEKKGIWIAIMASMRALEEKLSADAYLLDAMRTSGGSGRDAHRTARGVRSPADAPARRHDADAHSPGPRGSRRRFLLPKICTSTRQHQHQLAVAAVQVSFIVTDHHTSQRVRPGLSTAFDEKCSIAPEIAQRQGYVLAQIACIQACEARHRPHAAAAGGVAIRRLPQRLSAARRTGVRGSLMPHFITPIHHERAICTFTWVFFDNWYL